MNTGLPTSSIHPHQSRRFTETLRLIQARAQQSSVTLRELLEIFGPQGHGFVALFLVLPFLQPIPLVGLSTVFGLAIATVGFLMVLDRPPWLPQRLARVVVESNTVLKVCATLEGLMKRLERLVKPRGQRLFAALWFRRLNGLVLFIHALIMALPLPIPLSNFLPALVLLLIALGTLEEDAIVVFVGYGAVVINAAFFTALVLLPFLGIRLLAA